jgi:hypothetical protein
VHFCISVSVATPNEASSKTWICQMWELGGQAQGLLLNT